MTTMDQARAAERVPAPAITGLIEDALAAVGLPAADAGKVAELMIEADLTGADAHGVFRLPQYVRRMRAGGVNPQARHHGRARPRRRPRWSTATTAWATW